jgi:hypothetical protein
MASAKAFAMLLFPDDENPSIAMMIDFILC